jgi:anti-sigma regulatory factor (Ser/Thr protein kinase)
LTAEAASVSQEASADAPTVRLELESRPETLTLVRGMLGGVAEPLAIDPELLDDLKTAVSEACNNVVLHAYPAGVGPLTVLVNVRLDGIEVTVRDQGRGIGGEAPPADHAHGIGLPVIRALTARAEFRARPGGGTEVWMLFGGQRDGKDLFERPADAVPEDGLTRQLRGDAIVSISPVELLNGVLGRIARALAATARFSLDRFSDVYLVTDAIAAHAGTSASGERIAFAIKSQPRRLELTVGPFRRGSWTGPPAEPQPGAPRSPLAVLSDELRLEPSGDSEMLHAVMIDRRPWSAGSGV